MSDEILTLAEVRQIYATKMRVTASVAARLCAAVEYWYQKAESLRPDAETWRSVCAQGREIQRETETPEVRAEIAAKVRAKREEEEELRLLRAWEAAQRRVFDTPANKKDEHESAVVSEEVAWAALDDFRERQKEASHES